MDTVKWVAWVGSESFKWMAVNQSNGRADRCEQWISQMDGKDYQWLHRELVLHGRLSQQTECNIQAEMWPPVGRNWWSLTIDSVTRSSHKAPIHHACRLCNLAQVVIQSAMISIFWHGPHWPHCLLICICPDSMAQAPGGNLVRIVITRQTRQWWTVIQSNVDRGGIEPVKWMTRVYSETVKWLVGVVLNQWNGWPGCVQWNSQMVDKGGIEPVKWMTEVNQAKGCMDR